MGQKVNPICMRIGITRNWVSNWYAEKDYAKAIAEDDKIRSFINNRLKNSGVCSVEIDRAAENLKINIYAARPGLIIGRRGEDADKLKKSLVHLVKKDLILNIKEVKRAEINAQAIAQNIATQIERRLAFRRVMKKAMQNALRFKIDGCKIMLSGRLNGAEMARTEWIREGRVPLHTLKANIAYATCEALTTYGIIGIKVWVFNESHVAMRRKK